MQRGKKRLHLYVQHVCMFLTLGTYDAKIILARRIITRCSAIAEKPRYRVRYSFRQK